MSYLSIHDKDFDKLESLRIPIAIIKKIRTSDVPATAKYVIFGDDCAQLFNSYKYNENAKQLYKLFRNIPEIKAELVGLNVYITIRD